MMNRDANAAGLYRPPRQKYLSLALHGAQRAIAYRRTTLLDLTAGVMAMVATYYVWKAVYQVDSHVAGFDWETMRAYVLISYALNALLSIGVESRMFTPIRTGNIVVELTRPVDYMAGQAALALGAASAECVFAAGVISFGFVFDIVRMPNVFAGALFVLSVVLGVSIKFLISYITALVCFWTMNDWGVMWMRAAVANLLSGVIVPLDALPSWFGTLARVAPFQATVYTPVSIAVGHLSGVAALAAIVLQILWLVVLVVLGRVLWIPSLRALTVQGG